MERIKRSVEIVAPVFPWKTDKRFRPQALPTNRNLDKVCSGVSGVQKLKILGPENKKIVRLSTN